MITDNKRNKIEALKVLDWEELTALPTSTYEEFTLEELTQVTGSVVDSFKLTGNERGLLTYVLNEKEILEELIYNQLDRSYLLSELNTLLKDINLA